MTHGGRRTGAGRRSPHGETKVIRLPVSTIRNIQQFAAMQSFKLPLYSSRVQAGMPSQADDHVEETIDLNNHLVKHPANTFLVRATGDSMKEAGIHEGNLMVVDRSIKPTHGKIVIAAIDGQLTVKFLLIRQGKAVLMPATPGFPEIPVDEENGITIWGVVTSTIKSF